MKKWMALLLLPILIYVFYSQFPDGISARNDSVRFSEHLDNIPAKDNMGSDICTLVDRVINSKGKVTVHMEDRTNAYPEFDVTESAGNALKALVEENEMTVWQEVEIESVTIEPPFICVLDSEGEAVLFLLDQPAIDIVEMDANGKVVALARNIGDDSINGTFIDRIQSWFSVNEISIEHIVLDERSSISSAEISDKVMEMYCKWLVNISSINPYSVSAAEVLSTSIVEQLDEKKFVFLGEYAVKPNHIEFSDWYSGQGAEPMSNAYEGWLLLHREITSEYNEDSHCWTFSW